MSKIVQIKIFNDLLDQFFEFLETNFALYKSDIILTKSTTNFIRNSNPRLVVEQFVSIVGPYKKQIFDCDEIFFMEFEKNIKVSSENLLAGMKIKSMWKSDNITERQRAFIWMYFQKLIKAGLKVVCA